MATPTGKFVWYEWMGDDLNAAVDFYAHVVGWTAKRPTWPASLRRPLGRRPSASRGMMTIPAEAKAMGAPPCWTGYIWVEDVDVAAGEARSPRAGGSSARRADIPGVGRFAVVTDPHGATFMLFRDAGGNPPPRPPPDTPGLVGWRELHAGDGADAFDFYCRPVRLDEGQRHRHGADGRLPAVRHRGGERAAAS